MYPMQQLAEQLLQLYQRIEAVILHAESCLLETVLRTPLFRAAVEHQDHAQVVLAAMQVLRKEKYYVDLRDISLFCEHAELSPELLPEDAKTKTLHVLACCSAIYSVLKKLEDLQRSICYALQELLEKKRSEEILLAFILQKLKETEELVAGLRSLAKAFSYEQEQLLCELGKKLSGLMNKHWNQQLLEETKQWMREWLAALPKKKRGSPVTV